MLIGIGAMGATGVGLAVELMPIPNSTVGRGGGGEGTKLTPEGEALIIEDCELVPLLISIGWEAEEIIVWTGG